VAAGFEQAGWITAFEGRYGAGSHARLLEALRQPCVTFADIAASFGVTRECVRQWHRALLPEAPTGHERQRLCAQYHRRRRLFRDPLFRAFFRHAREQFPPGRVEPIAGKDGYRTRTVLIDKRPVALRDCQTLVRHRGGAEFIYVQLQDTDFLFVPAELIPSNGLSISPAALRGYERYRNSFAAFVEAGERRTA
jgi:hypothetical protein